MRHYPYIVAALASVVLCFASVSTDGVAQDQAAIAGLFTVYDVAVDEQGVSAAAARQSAIKEAEVKAYEWLLVRLVPADERALVPPFESQELSAIVSGYEIKNEATSRGRYLADINVSFNPNKIIDHWSNAGIAFALNAGPTLCFAHGHFGKGDALLWEIDNPAKVAWQQTDWKNALRRYRPVEATLKIRAGLDVGLIWSAPKIAAENLAKSCGMSDAMIVATKYDDRDGHMAYKYWVSDVALAGEGVIFLDAEETTTDAITRILDDVLLIVDENWRRLSTVRGNAAEELTLLVEVQRVEDLARARAELAKLSIVRTVTLDRVAVPLSRLSVRYTGSLEQLTLAAKQAGYDVIVWGEGYMLSPRVN